MNVFLINPPLVKPLPTKRLSYPPLGILTLSSFLKIHGHQVQVLDLAMEKKTFPEILEMVEGSSSQVIGITLYTEIIHFVSDLIFYLKEHGRELKIILGGPHCSVLPEESMGLGEVDVVVQNEGEAPLLEILATWEYDQSFQLSDVPGICYEEKGKTFKNPRRGRLELLNLLPIPDRDAIDLHEYNDPYSLICSRGCPGRCVFCATRPINGVRFRARSAAHMFGEVLLLQKVYKAKTISFLEDTFTADLDRFLQFAAWVEGYGLKMNFRCETRIDKMTKGLLDTMAAMGFDSIQYGIETGDPRVMKAIRKDIDLTYAEEIVAYTRRLGILPALSFCLGHYADTKESLERTVAFIRKLVRCYDPHITVSFNTPFPGTYQYNHLEELGLHLTTKDWSHFTLLSPITYTDNYSVRDLYLYHFQILSTLMAREISKNRRGEVS